jgi:hypothetical protein
MRRGPASAEDTTGEGHEVKRPGQRVKTPAGLSDAVSGGLPDLTYLSTTGL